MVKIETIDCIKNRISVREYKATPVPDDIIKELLEAATRAPSAGNK